MRENVIIAVALIVIVSVSFIFAIFAEPVLQALIPSAFEQVRRIDMFAFGFLIWLILRETNKPLITKLDGLERRLSRIDERLNSMARNANG